MHEEADLVESFLPVEIVPHEHFKHQFPQIPTFSADVVLSLKPPTEVVEIPFSTAVREPSGECIAEEQESEIPPTIQASAIVPPVQEIRSSTSVDLREAELDRLPVATSCRGGQESASMRASMRAHSVRTAFFEKNGMTTRTLDKVRRFFIPRSEITVHKKVGEGACCEVFHATVFGESAAIKTLRTTAYMGVDAVPEEMHTMISELRVLADKFDHPNIVHFKGVCVEQEVMLLAFEFMKGGSLEDFFGQASGGSFARPSPRRCSQAQTLNWSADLLAALAFLHSFQPPIVHRDLKPANLMLSGDLATLKLADFGLSRAIVQPDAADGSAPQPAAHALRPSSLQGRRSSVGRRNSAMTEFVGTPRYMAPEIAQREGRYDEKVDVYAAGLIMWFMVEGKRPWPTLDGTTAMMAATTGARPPMTRKRFSVGMINIIASAWEHDPLLRRPAAELLSSLHAVRDAAAVRSGCFGGLHLLPAAASPRSVADSFRLKRTGSVLDSFKRSASSVGFTRSLSLSWKPKGLGRSKTM